MKLQKPISLCNLYSIWVDLGHKVLEILPFKIIPIFNLNYFNLLDTLLSTSDLQFELIVKNFFESYVTNKVEIVFKHVMIFLSAKLKLVDLIEMFQSKNQWFSIGFILRSWLKVYDFNHVLAAKYDKFVLIEEVHLVERLVSLQAIMLIPFLVILLFLIVINLFFFVRFGEVESLFVLLLHFFLVLFQVSS